MDITTYFAREAKVAPEKVAALREGPGAAAFTAVEKNVLRMADGMSATPAHVDDTVFRELHAELGAEGMVELAAAIATENFSARFNHAFEIAPAGLGERKSRRG